MKSVPRSGVLRLAAGALAILLCAGPAATHARAEAQEISARRALEKKAFTDEEIAEGFFKVAFGAELGFGGRVDRIRKYLTPVRIYVESDPRAKPDRRFGVSEIVADIRSRIWNLDITVTAKRLDANFIVRLVRDRDLPAAVRKVYGERSSRIVRSLEPQCLSGFRKDAQYRITRSDVILVVDKGEFIFRDCAYEEILQALGPIRDDSSVPWTMFNDDVQMGFFGLYDQHLLNLLYHPSVQPGMTKEEVRALLPQIMPEVRAFVANRNKGEPRLPTSGDFTSRRRR